MQKTRKTSHITNIIQFDADGHVVIPASLTLGIAPSGVDNSAKVPSTAWVRSFVAGLGYVTGNEAISITGDATGSGTTSINITLANTGVVAGQYGSSTSVPVITVDSKGRVTSLSTASISGALTFTGDVTGSGTTGSTTTLTLSNTGVTAGTYTKVTVDAKGRVTSATLATTSDIGEGTNLYYTDGRVASYLTANGYATQSYVTTQINNLVNGAPGLLDTLDELAAALGDDPNFATTVTTALSNRLRIDIGTQGLTSTQQGYGRTNLGLGALAVLSSIGDAYITDLAWSKLTGVPSTFTPSPHTHDDRYYTESEIANFFSGSSVITGYNKSSWDTAYGWGNHASAGYLTTSSAASTYVSLSGSYANPAWITSLAWSKITGAPAFLTSYTETDPYRVTAVAVSGTSTKTITITRADSSTVTTTWTDYDTDTNTYVTSASFSGGTLTLTRNDAGTISVSLDGRYLQSYTETDTLATVTARGSSTTGSITVNGYVTVAGGADLNLKAASGSTDAGDIVFQDGSGNELHRLWQGSSTLNYRTNGGTTYQLWHTGNLTNLNQLTNGPGYITGITSSMVTTALGYTPQNSSTAITTSNIGSQSVSYASSAGNADTVDGYHESAFLRYYGYSTSGDFQAFQSTAGRIRFDQVGAIDNGSWSNRPTGVYTYGGVLSLRGDSFGLQIYGSHTGDLVFKTQWNNDQYSGWRTIIHSSNIGSQSVNYASSSGNADTVDGYHASSFWIAGGGWSADFSSYNYVRQIGVSYTGGEFVILTKDAQISTLIDGSYFAGESGGFYSLNNSNQFTSRVGFYRDGDGYANFNSTVKSYALRGTSNVAGTGEASYHPAGIYSTGTNWLYGTMYLNVNSINDTGDIRTYNSGYSFRARYTAGSDIYHSSLNWYGLQLGNNGDNYIIGGRTATGGNITFYVNNTSDFTTINGTFAAKMHSSGRTSFGANSDNGYQVQVYGSLYASDWIRVAGGQGLYFESYGGGWRMTDSSYIRSYNAKALSMEGASVDYVGSIYMNGGVYIQTNNNRNLQVTSSGAGDNGIYGRGNSGQFCYQLYGDGGGSYGFLDGVWASWDIRKVVNGAMYMNDNNSYYLQTESTSRVYHIHADYLSVGQGINTNYRIITNGDYYANGGGNFWAEGRFKQYRGSGTWHDVIDSGNIGSQSVNYANSAGSASSVAWGNISGRPDWMTSASLIAGLSNANSQVNSGFYENGGCGSNWPSCTWYNAINVRHSNQGNYHGFQIAMSYYDNNLWFRSYQGSGTFQSWAVALSNQNFTSYIDAPNKAGTSYYQVNTWLQFNGNHGLYWPSYYGAHFYPNNYNSYGQFRLDGSKNGYGGIVDSYSAVTGIMYDSGGNGGVYREANGRWYWYYHLGNACMGINTSTTSSSYAAYVNGNLYATGDITAYSDRRKKTDIVTIDSALDKVTQLRGVYYTKIDETEKGRQMGVIAQEINEVLPEVVTYAADVDEYGVKYGNIVGVLIEAIKEQQAQIEDLKNQITELKENK